MSDKITQIYELSSIGYDQLMKELNSVNTAFERVAASKRESAKAPAIAPGTVKDLAEARQKVAELRVEEQNLLAQKKQLANEAKALSIAQQAETNSAKAAAAAIQNQAGSYNLLLKEYRELYTLTKATGKGNPVDFRGQLLGYDEAIAKLKQLAAAEQDFRRQFAKDGLLVGEYTTGIINAFKKQGLDDLIGGQITKSKEKLQDLNAEFDRLSAELRQAQAAGQTSLEAIERELIENRNEATRLSATVNQLETDFRGAGDAGGQISASIKEGFKNAGNEIRQMVVQYVGFQAALEGIRGGVSNAYDLADATTAIEVELGKAAGGAQGLIDELKKLDTRTDLKVLEDMANIAIKAGVAEENVAGVTEAIDKIKTAFGADFGEVEKGTEDLVKLVNVFYDGEVTGDNMLKIGNAVRTIANESVASVPYLNDFSGRMAGLAGVTSITLPQVLGMASGFEQFKQSAEVSSTALVKIIPKLAEDTKKYSAIVGMTQKQFSDLLNNNPFEALLQISEKLAGNAGGLEEISKALSDAELGSGRVTTILGTMGSKADTFREAMKSASGAVTNADSINKAFAARNENLAGTLDKVKKQLLDAASSQAFQTTIKTIAGAVLTLIKYLPQLLVLLGVMGTAWLVNNAGLVLLNAELTLYNLLIVRNRVLLAGLTIAQGLFTIALKAGTLAFNLAARAAQLFGVALRATPLGLVLTGVALLGTSLAAMATALKNSTAELERQARISELYNGIQAKAKEQNNDAISKITTLTGVVKDHSNSLDVRKRALEELIAISPEYLEGLTLENIATEQGTKLIDDYIDSLNRKAEAEAISALKSEKFRERLKLQQLEMQLAEKKANGQTDLEDLTDEEKEFVGKARKNFAFTASLTDLATGDSALGEAEAAVKAAGAKITQELDDIDALAKEKFAELFKLPAEGKKVAAATVADLEDDKKKTKAKKAEDPFDIETRALENAMKERKALLERQFLTNQVTEDQFAQQDLERQEAYLTAKIALLQKYRPKETGEIAALETEKIKLRKDFNNKAQAEAEARMKEGFEAWQKDIDAQKKVFDGAMDKIQADSDNRISKIKAIAAEARLKLQTDEQREVFDKNVKRTILSAEIDTINKQLPVLKDAYDRGLITEKAYNDALTELYTKRGQLGEAMVKDTEEQYKRLISAQDFINTKLSKALGFKPGSTEDQLLGEVLNQSYSLAADAMNGYFDAEEDRIQKSMDLAIQRLEHEKEIQLGRAQSQAEEESINKQFEANKLKVQKEAFEKQKQVRRNENRLSLLAELANIAVSAAANPLNAVTFGGAGAAMYALLAGIALGRFALRAGEINRATFEKGGMPGWTKTGGDIKGPSHAHGGVPFNYEAEGEELAIINKRSAAMNKIVALKGTPRQILSAINVMGGGISFAGGAVPAWMAQGGYIGANLSAPVYIPAQNDNDAGQMMAAIIEQARSIQAVSDRIDRIEVVQVTSKAVAAQKKLHNQTEVGTL